VAAIAQAAGYAVASTDIWAASDLNPGDLEDPLPHRPYPQPL
jgi:hypothetical protein